MTLQEEAIAYNFTMRELLYYFGTFYQMKLTYIRERTEFLKEFLDLSTADVLCSTLRSVYYSWYTILLLRY